MSKIKKISGFPEWLPQHKITEDLLIQRIKAVYQSFGFTPIETAAVELMSTLAAKGVIDKEIYKVVRAQAESSTEEAAMALHFDLTVPFARYVAQNYNELDFPFKRYQLQKVWRGDRPQKGRFREFYQFDIDVIARDSLPLSFDAETVEVLDQAFAAMNLAPYIIKLNNRKLLLGLYRSLGLDEASRKKAIVAVDKLNKIGPEGVVRELCEGCGVSDSVAQTILQYSAHRIPLAEVSDRLSKLIPNDEWCAEGASELGVIAQLVGSETAGRVEVDLSLARGLEYYTGTIIEVYLRDHQGFGAVASGGRYEDLASEFIGNKKLPGVGASIGLTRLMDFVIENAVIKSEQKSPTVLLVTVLSEEQRPNCNEIARRARKAGVPTEVFYLAPKLGKQIDYADGKGIPFVLFLSADGGIQIKNIRSKEQTPVADLELWCQAFVNKR